MGHESTELSLYHYGGLQQIHHWTTWFSTAPRHRWIHLQPPERPLKYRTDKSFALASRLVVFLAFVPLEHIESAFEALSMHIAGTYPELMAIVNYFELTYLGLAQLYGTRAGTKFGIEHWNHYEMVLIDPGPASNH